MRIGCLVVVIAVAALGLVALGLAASGVLAGVFGALRGGGLLSEDSADRIVEEVVSGSALGTERRIVIIDVKGIILSGDGFDIAGSRRICHELKAARRDKRVAAIVLDMDTPGGEVTASDEIHREVRRCGRDGIPVVTCMHGMGASGGYFVAAGSDWIVANRLTITGSIGVIISTLNYKGFLDKIGVDVEVYRSGRMKDMLRGSRERTDMEKAYTQALVDGTFREFAAVVAGGRVRYDTPEAVMQSEFGDGRILTGADAFRLGLIDQVGYFDEAIEKAKELGKAPVVKVVRYRRPMRLSDLLFGVRAGSASTLRRFLTPEAGAVSPGRLYFLMPEAVL